MTILDLVCSCCKSPSTSISRRHCSLECVLLLLRLLLLRHCLLPLRGTRRVKLIALRRLRQTTRTPRAVKLVVSPQRLRLWKLRVTRDGLRSFTLRTCTPLTRLTRVLSAVPASVGQCLIFSPYIFGGEGSVDRFASLFGLLGSFI